MDVFVRLTEMDEGRERNREIQQNDMKSEDEKKEKERQRKRL